MLGANQRGVPYGQELTDEHDAQKWIILSRRIFLLLTAGALAAIVTYAFQDQTRG